MNLSSRVYRKFLYAAIIALMLLPLYRLGQPMTNSSASGQASGGVLANMRQKYNLAESNLGEIDPASDSMRLATLGMRGVAATMLWQRSHEYIKRHEWDRLSATLDVLALLQPHFEKVWEHQSHNLSYNVSTEFDDYRQRYNWVKKGTEFLMRGVRRNSRAPRLVWYTGWFFGWKLGVSDEKTQYRRLFSEDQQYHSFLNNQSLQADDKQIIDLESPAAIGPYGKPDNWLVGRLWMLFAYDLVDNKNVPLLRKNPLNFYQDAAQWRSQHAIVIEEEGVLDNRAENAWRLAVKDWQDYAARDLPTFDGYTVRLGDLSAFAERTAEVNRKFEELVEGVSSRLLEERFKALPQETQTAMDTPLEKRTERQKLLAQRGEGALYFGREDLVKALPAEKQLFGMQLLEQLADIEAKTNKINGYRTQTNFDYWYMRSVAEQEPETLAARKLVFDAEAAMNSGEIDKAQQKYEEAFKHWAEIFDRYPVLVTDVTADTIGQSIERYKSILDEEILPDDFPLKTFVELRGPDGGRLDQSSYVEAREKEKGKIAQELSTNQVQLPSIEDAIVKPQDVSTLAPPTPKPNLDSQAKSEQPQPEEPKPEEPKPEEPKPEEPKSEEPKSEEPKPQEPKPQEPKPEEPKPEEPKPEEPKPEEPKPEEPKPEEPKPEEPKPEEPKSEEPKSEEPSPRNQSLKSQSYSL